MAKERGSGGEVAVEVGNIEAQFSGAETPIGCGQQAKNNSND